MEKFERNTRGTRNAWKNDKQGRFQVRNPMMVLKKLEQFLELNRMPKASKKKIQRLIEAVKPIYRYGRHVLWKVRSIVV